MNRRSPASSPIALLIAFLQGGPEFGELLVHLLQHLAGMFQSNPTAEARAVIRCALPASGVSGECRRRGWASPSPLCSSSFLICSQFARTASTLVGPGVAEDMGVAADHLLGDRAEDGGDVEISRLFGHPREEEDLKEEIAELLHEPPDEPPSIASRTS